MFASCIVDIIHSNVDRVFDYEADEGLKPGTRVLVPFGNRLVEGFVLQISERTEYRGTLKKVCRALDDFPALNAECLGLAKWISKEYHVILAEALRLFIPAEMRGSRVSVKTRTVCELADESGIASLKKNARAQWEVVHALLSARDRGETLSPEFFTEHYAACKALEKKGILRLTETEVSRVPYEEMASPEKNVELTAEQRRAVSAILSEPATYLLFGVTGSGKTEVYLECIRARLREGKTAILLVPEISLTPQMLRRFRGIFGEQVAILHSGLSAGERFDEWRRIRKGEARIVIGARSAVFAPVEDLGLIIIDEEHETSYNSENAPRYRTVDIARQRAAYHGCALVLGSATPLVESYYRAKKGEYRLLTLEHRVNGRTMPAVEIVDMKRELRRGNNSIFSGELEQALAENFERGEQSILFLNRRGYSPAVICSDCGYVAKCTDCDVTLCYHEDEGVLKCHYCGNRYDMLTECPKCGGKHLTKRGAGTQRIAAELKKILPRARVLRMDNDTTQTKEAHFKITEAFGKGEADVLVGTQMIAKGHDFPNVTLVGAVDADQSLYFSDYRSIERTFSLITQVAGRAGRAERAGRVILQTLTPNHFVYKLIAAYDYRGFFEREIALREATAFPPFSVIVKILFVGEDEAETVACLKSAFEKVSKLREDNPGEFFFLNRMKSPVRRIMKKFRYQIVMRVRSERMVSDLYDIADSAVGKHTVNYVEVNPSNMS